MRQPAALLAVATSAIALSAALVTAAARLDAGAPAPARAQGELPADPKTIKIAFDNVVQDVDIPVDIANAGDGSGRLFIVEKPGRIRIVKDGQLLDAPFLDITDRVEAAANERGLLGLAFHPEYAENWQFYVYYTSKAVRGRKRGDLVIARYHATADRDKADPDAELQLLTIEHNINGNHNGGNLEFGPDGYLYIGTGDGGGGGDPFQAGQDANVLLGKMLRIDVDTGDPYVIPPSNPFASTPRRAPEVWAYGLRNPWKFTFDRATGDLYIADVGQNAWEEVNHQPADSKGGENYGWSVMEGSHCFNPQTGCDQRNKVLPVAEYSHSLGLSITGGEVYRGEAFPGLTGTYFYADYSRGRIWALSRGTNGQWRNAEILTGKNGITSFGRDENGEIYIALETGRIQRLRDANAVVRPTNTPTDPPPPATTEPAPVDTPTAVPTTPPSATPAVDPGTPTPTASPVVDPLPPVLLPSLLRAHP
ncbi:MAG: PQQ-dependent sugar dehydrogenase [Ardenticatenales bacterium]|nr:PQQ-dependent sugar dehydrogenase [Ardenticatenales bacterium]